MAKDTITVSLGISYAGLMGLTFVSLVIMAGKSSGFGHPDDLGMIVRILFSYIGYGGLLITSLVLILIFINAKEEEQVAKWASTLVFLHGLLVYSLAYL